MENLINALNRLQENATFCRQHFEYKKAMHQQYAAFFAAKNAGKPFAEAVKVFDTLPQPQTEPQRIAKAEVLNSLIY